MNKLIAISLSVALSLILVDTAFSNTQTQKSEPLPVVKTEAVKTEVVKTEAETPLCYLQTPDGKTWDLNNLCEKQPKEANSPKTTVATTNPYNNASIKKFDDELYGVGN